MEFKQIDNTYVLVLKRGEEVISSITQFAEEQGIKSGSFTGIGAVDDPVLSSYNVHTKEYTARELHGEFELLSLNGNYSMKDGKAFAHVHAVVSNIDAHCFGGHLNQCTVAATTEIFITCFESELIRKYDEDTGLYLISI